jgi:hypothetical protein
MKIVRKLLLESRKTRYLEMFPSRNIFGVKYNYGGYLRLFERKIDSAIDIFKRHDRVIWYLRHALVDLLNDILASHSSASGGKLEKKTKDLQNLIISKYREEDKSKVQSLRGINVRYFTHYLDLPIHEIQEYQFKWQAPTEILEYFEAAEAKWKAETQSLIPNASIAKLPENEKPELLIDYGDGFYLYDLKKNGCRLEANAMGHCSTGAHEGDTNWSIREKVRTGSSYGWRPVVTIIWNENGWVNEIKGAGNKKPGEEFFPHIVKALMLDRVEGHFWPHNGYATDEDFTVLDLPVSEQLEIIAKKPTIFPALELVNPVNKEIDPGFTEENVKAVNAYLYQFTQGGFHDLKALPTDHPKYKTHAFFAYVNSAVELLNNFPDNSRVARFRYLVGGTNIHGAYSKTLSKLGGSKALSNIEEAIKIALEDPDYYKACRILFTSGTISDDNKDYRREILSSIMRREGELNAVYMSAIEAIDEASDAEANIKEDLRKSALRSGFNPKNVNVEGDKFFTSPGEILFDHKLLFLFITYKSFYDNDYLQAEELDIDTPDNVFGYVRIPAVAQEIIAFFKETSLYSKIMGKR